MSHYTDLLCEATTVRELDAAVIDATDIGTCAIEYAVRNWRVFPLTGKVPAIAGGRGVLDASSDVNIVASWWGGAYRGCNIGGRVPEPMVVIDIDPRHGGIDSLAAIEGRYGPLPETLTTLSGRGDGGRHLFYRRPVGRLSARRLGPGIDVKTSSGYVVLAPSIHPDSGKPYIRIDAPVAAPPPWFTALLLPAPLPPMPRYASTQDGGLYSLRCLVARIAAAPEGRRNITLFGACRDALSDGNLDAFEDDLAATARSIGLPDHEIRGTVASARRVAA